MADEEEDYLSDKFLQQLTSKVPPSSSKSYAERRKEAQRQAEIRNLAGRTKSRKELEKEALETLKEGLNTSLFEKERLAAAEGGAQSKAMKMMSKMGFKPGQALGRQEKTSQISGADGAPVPKHGPKSTPIDIHIWEGRKGLGAMKRPLSPPSASDELERAARLARANETSSQENYRSRGRLEYEEKRDEGRLISAQKTCADLDEKHGVKFNHIVFNVNLPHLFPAGIREELEIDTPEIIDDSYHSRPRKRRRQDNLEQLGDDEITNSSPLAERLRQEMKRDALRSSARQEDFSGEDEHLHLRGYIGRTSHAGNDDGDATPVAAEVLVQIKQFLQEPIQERLRQVLHYMRETYYFCFWCGTEYKSKEELDASCPGKAEEDHD